MNPIVSISVALIMTIVMFSPAFAADQEDEIRRLVAEFNDAYLQNDLDRYFSFYDDNATIWFDSGRSTLSSYRESWYALIRAGGGVLKNALRDLEIQMSPSGDAAIATYQVTVETQYPDSRISDQRAHETDVWFRTSRGWRISHVHYTAESESAN